MRTPPPSWALAVALGVAVGGVASVARAHAPQARSVALTPDGISVALSMPGFGVLLRTEPAGPFGYLCDAALGHQPADAPPSMVFVADGSLLFGTADGMRRVAPDGCPDASEGTLSAAAVVALAGQPGTDVVYAATGGDLPAVWRSGDGGRTWERKSTLASAELVTALLVSTADPDTVYISRGTAEQSTLLVSVDAGASFNSFDQARGLTLLHVPGADSDQFWALTRSADNVANRGFDLMHADLLEGPWAFAVRVNYFGGFSIDAEGIAWIGDESGGLHRSDDNGETFVNVGPDQAVACLAAASHGMWACTPGTNLQPALMVQDEGATTLEPVVAFADVDHLVECSDEVNVPESCAGAWIEWRRDVRMEDLTMADAGVTDAGTDAGVAATDALSNGPDNAGCSILAGKGTRPSRSIVLVLFLVLVRVRVRGLAFTFFRR